jgi:hypothetical protein
MNINIAVLLAKIAGKSPQKAECTRDGNQLGPTFDGPGSVIWCPETVAIINRTLAQMKAETP